MPRANVSAIRTIPARILAVVVVTFLGVSMLASPASAADKSYNGVIVFGNATNGTTGALYSLVQLDAVGGSGPGGSGTATVTNLVNNVSYTATLNCVYETTNTESQRVLHVTGTVDPGPVLAQWFTLTIVATPLLNGTANRVSSIGINHRNTKPYRCTVPSTIDHSTVSGLLTVS